MIKYIGTKTILAKEMNRARYNEYRGWELPTDENGADAGMLVEYIDGGASNHPKHEGYISWSPMEVFEKAYKVIKGMDFGDAIRAMKTGAKVARADWNGKSMFVFLVSGSTFEVNRAPLLDIYPAGTTINYHAHIDMCTADSTIVPWLASQTDVLAEDWELVS